MLFGNLLERVPREFRQDFPTLLARDYTTHAKALLIFLGPQEDWTNQGLLSVEPIKKPEFKNLNFVEVVPVVCQAHLTTPRMP